VKTIVEILTAWGPFGLFLLAVLDSAGIPLPTGVDALLIFLSIEDPRRAYLYALLATVGSLIGSYILFYIARKGGERYLDQHTQSGRAARFRQWFQRYGLLTVFIPALLPIPLPLKVFVLSAGALGVSTINYLIVVAAARLLRYFGLAWLGMQLGRESLTWLKSHVWHLLGGAVVLFLLLYLLVRIIDARRSGRESAPLPPPAAR
jgi:membrane protein YqaA with SNARE-associated domain